MSFLKFLSIPKEVVVIRPTPELTKPVAKSWSIGNVRRVIGALPKSRFRG